MAILTDEERDIDPYEVLGLTPEATEKEVRKAYRKKSLKCHPDKNPGAEAEAMFHLISMAQAILLAPEKRKFVDTKLATARAQAARRAEMDSKRKAKVDDLLRREEDAKRAKKEAGLARKAAAEEESVRDAGRRMVEEARKRREAANAAQAAAEAQPPAEPVPSSRNTPPPISALDLTLSLQLPPACALSQDELETALRGKYGTLAGVLLAPAKKKKGPRAVVEFAPGNWGGCWACMHDNAGIEGAKAKWAAGTEPAWVKWAEETGSASRVNGGAKDGANGSSTPNFASAPDFSGQGEDQRRRQREEDAALESATLFRMRQAEREKESERERAREAERQRLADEIRRQEE